MAGRPGPASRADAAEDHHSDPVEHVTYEASVIELDSQNPSDAAVADDVESEIVLAQPALAPGALAVVAALPPDRNPALVYIARLQSENSKRTMAFALGKVASLIGTSDFTRVPWHLLRYQHTAALRAKLAATMQPATANLCLVGLRGVLREAWRLGLLMGDDYHRARDVSAVEGTRLPAGRSLSPDEVARLASACDLSTLIGARDAAMLAVLCGGGPRRFEVCQAKLADYDREQGDVRVIGKRNKERIVTLPAWARDAVNHWLSARGDVSPSSHLLCPLTKHGTVIDRGLSVSSVWSVCTKLAAKAGLAKFSPHDFRRTFVGDMLDSGVDIATVQKLVGHSSVQTTARYDRRPDAVKREAVARLPNPFAARQEEEPK